MAETSTDDTKTVDSLPPGVKLDPVDNPPPGVKFDPVASPPPGVKFDSAPTKTKTATQLPTSSVVAERKAGVPHEPTPQYDYYVDPNTGLLFSTDPQEQDRLIKMYGTQGMGTAAGSVSSLIGAAQFFTPEDTALQKLLAGTQKSIQDYVKENKVEAGYYMGRGLGDIALIEAGGAIPKVLEYGGAALEGAPLVGKYATQAGEYLAPAITRTKEIAGKIVPSYLKPAAKWVGEKLGLEGEEAAAAATEGTTSAVETAKTLDLGETALGQLKKFTLNAPKSVATGGLIGAAMGRIAPRAEAQRKEREKARYEEMVNGLEAGAFLGLAGSATATALEGGYDFFTSHAEEKLKLFEAAYKEQRDAMAKLFGTKSKEAEKTIKAQTEEKAAAEAGIVPAKKETERLSGILEEIKTGGKKKVPVERDGEVVMGTRGEAQALRPEQLSETQRRVYDRLMQQSSEARTKVETLRAQTEAQNPQRQQQLAEQLAKLKNIQEQMDQMGASTQAIEPASVGLSAPERAEFEDYQSKVLKSAEDRAKEITEAERGDPTKRMPFDQFAGEVRSAVDRTQSELEYYARNKSKLAELDQKWEGKKAFGGRNVVNEFERLTTTTGNPTVRAALENASNILKKEMDGAGKVTFKILDDTQKVLNDAYNSGIVASSGVAKSAGGAGAKTIAEARDFVRKEIEAVEPEFEAARTQYAELMKPLDPYKKGGIFDQIATKDVHGYSLNEREVVKQLIERSNAGQEGLADLLKQEPQLKEAARAYFNGVLFGVDAEKTLSNAQLNQFLNNNSKVLKEFGLFEDFKDMKAARDIAKEQIDAVKEAQKETQRIYGQLKKEEGVTSAVESEAKEASKMTAKAEQRMLQVEAGKEEPSALQAKRMPGGVTLTPAKTIEDKSAARRGEAEKTTKESLAQAKTELSSFEKQLKDADTEIDRATKLKNMTDTIVARAEKATDQKVKQIAEDMIDALRQQHPDLINIPQYEAMLDDYNAITENYEKTKNEIELRKNIKAWFYTRVADALLISIGASSGGYGIYRIIRSNEDARR